MHLFKHIKREEGQGLVEYALLLVLVAVVVIAILTILGSAVTLVFARVVGGLNGDTLENNGAVFLSADYTETDSGGICSASLTNVKYVAVDNSGNIIKQGAAPRSLYVNGLDSGKQVVGQASENGVATASGPYNVSGTCPLKFTLGTP